MNVKRNNNADARTHGLLYGIAITRLVRPENLPRPPLSADIRVERVLRAETLQRSTYERFDFWDASLRKSRARARGHTGFRIVTRL